MYSVCVEHWPAFILLISFCSLPLGPFGPFRVRWLMLTASPHLVWEEPKNMGPVAQRCLGQRGRWSGAKMCQVPSYPQGANQPHVMHQSEGSGGCSFSCHIVVHVFSWQARFWTRKEKTTEHSRPRPRPKPEMEAPSSNFGKKQPVRCVQVPLELGCSNLIHADVDVV